MNGYQRQMLANLRERGYVIENIRSGKGSHLIVRYTAPNGIKGRITLSLGSGDWRAPLNIEARLRRELCQPR